MKGRRRYKGAFLSKIGLKRFLKKETDSGEDSWSRGFSKSMSNDYIARELVHKAQ